MQASRSRASARRLPRALALPWIASAWLTSGCDSELSFGTLRAASDAGDGAVSAPFDAGQPRDAGDAGARDGGSVVFSCGLRGPLHPVADSLKSACAEPRGHHYALCSCAEVVNDDAGISVDGFDSRRGPYAPGQRSGSVALHGALNANAGATIGGSLLVGREVPIAGALSVGGDLAVGGALDGPADVRVGRDGYLAGDVRVRSLLVEGALTVAEGADVEVDAGPFARGPVAAPAPCRCDDALDRTALIEAARTDNDNGAIALDPGSLRAESAPITLNLPCGRYYVTEIFGARPITLRILGRVALYVADRILLDPNIAFTVELAADAELDLFVRNDITANGPVTLGGPDTSRRLRVHAGSPMRNLIFEGRTLIGGTVYAPTADLQAQTSFELYGALLAHRAVSSGRFVVHYDRALDADSCAEASCDATRSCASPLRCDVDRCLP